MPCLPSLSTVVAAVVVMVERMCGGVQEGESNVGETGEGMGMGRKEGRGKEGTAKHVHTYIQRVTRWRTDTQGTDMVSRDTVIQIYIHSNIYILRHDIPVSGGCVDPPPSTRLIHAQPLQWNIYKGHIKFQCRDFDHDVYFQEYCLEWRDKIMRFKLNTFIRKSCSSVSRLVIVHRARVIRPQTTQTNEGINNINYLCGWRSIHI